MRVDDGKGMGLLFAPQRHAIIKREGEGLLGSKDKSFNKWGA